MNQCITLFKSKKYNECVSIASKGLVKDPKSQGLLYLRASALVYIKEYELALKDVTLLLKCHPYYARGYILASNIFQFLGQVELSKSTLEIGLKKVPPNDKRFTELKSKYDDLCHPKPCGVYNFGAFFLPLELLNSILS